MDSFVFWIFFIIQASLTSQCQAVLVDQNSSSTHNAPLPTTIPQLSTFRPVLDMPVDQNLIPQHVNRASLPTVPSAACGAAPPGPAEGSAEVTRPTSPTINTSDRSPHGRTLAVCEIELSHGSIWKLFLKILNPSVGLMNIHIFSCWFVFTKVRSIQF